MARWRSTGATATVRCSVQRQALHHRPAQPRREPAEAARIVSLGAESCRRQRNLDARAPQRRQSRNFGNIRHAHAGGCRRQDPTGHQRRRVHDRPRRRQWRGIVALRFVHARQAARPAHGGFTRRRRGICLGHGRQARLAVLRRQTGRRERQTGHLAGSLEERRNQPRLLHAAVLQQRALRSRRRQKDTGEVRPGDGLKDLVGQPRHAQCAFSAPR